MIQSILVILAFGLASGFMLKKFIWDPIAESKQSSKEVRGNKPYKCPNKNCGCS